MACRCTRGQAIKGLLSALTLAGFIVGWAAYFAGQDPDADAETVDMWVAICAAAHGLFVLSACCLLAVKCATKDASPSIVEVLPGA